MGFIRRGKITRESVSEESRQKHWPGIYGCCKVEATITGLISDDADSSVEAACSEKVLRDRNQRDGGCSSLRTK